MKMILRRNIHYTQAKGWKFCLHIGTWALYIGKQTGRVKRLELATPIHWFRYTT